MPKSGNLKPFPKGVSGNPKGRPKKLYSTINQQLLGEGYEKMTKTQLIDAYQIIFNVDESRLKQIENDSETPYSLRLLIKAMRDKKFFNQALTDYRNWTFGREAEAEERQTNVTVNIISKNDDLKNDEI